MRSFVLNIIIALTWTLLSGEVSVRELAVGFLLGFVILAVFAAALGSRAYIQTASAAARFAGYFLRELLIANVQMAVFALRRHPPLHAQIVAVPLRISSDTALTLLAATLTLMPGTVVMGFSDDRRTLYAHAIGLESAAAVRRSIRQLESRLLAVLPASAVAESRAVSESKKETP